MRLQTTAYAFCNSNSYSMSSGLLSRANRLFTSGICRPAFTGSVNGMRLTDGRHVRDTGTLQVRDDAYNACASRVVSSVDNCVT
jgi:hypothetical protein